MDGNGIHKLLIVRLVLARRDSSRLPVRLGDELRSPHVRNPYLNGPEPLGAQPPPMLAYSIPGCWPCRTSHVTEADFS